MIGSRLRCRVAARRQDRRRRRFAADPGLLPGALQHRRQPGLGLRHRRATDDRRRRRRQRGAQRRAAVQRRHRRQRRGFRSHRRRGATTPTAAWTTASVSAASWCSQGPWSVKAWRCRATASSCWWRGATEVTTPATARFVVMRLNADGSPDTGFGNAGKVDTAFNESARASAVALQRDGKIVAVGARVLSPNANFIAARYNTDGFARCGIRRQRRSVVRLLFP